MRTAQYRKSNRHPGYVVKQLSLPGTIAPMPGTILVPGSDSCFTTYPGCFGARDWSDCADKYNVFPFPFSLNFE